MSNFVEVETDLAAEGWMIRDTAREFVKEKMEPDIGEHFIESTRDIHTLIVGKELTGLSSFK